tara:strand:+ start:2626 stop:4857 length:2232 start_codon:yes stop_codon:yes gene_type:complete
MLATITRFFKSFNSLKAILLALGMILPIFICNYFSVDLNIGFSIALGVLFCSPTDVPGSLKHKFFGILMAVILSFLLTLLMGFVAKINWVLIPLLSIIVFLVSYLAVFGFRASLISFSGLLAIVLSFAYDSSSMSLLEHAALIALGGTIYLSLSTIASYLLSKTQTNELFVETIEKTAEFLRIRGRLLVCTTKRDELYHRMFELQTEINGSHESIREVILDKQFKSGLSNSVRRQQLLFSELIDILELAVANPINYEEFDTVFGKHKEKIEGFKDLIFEITKQLEHISKVIRKEEKLTPNLKISEHLKAIDFNINDYSILVGLPKSRAGTLMLLNLKNYQEKQAQKITDLERILNNYIHNDKILGIKDANRFITPQDYDLKKLKENFSFKSPIFKHSFRLAIIVLIGFLVGSFFSMQNPYWILLTIIVIMRPSYGLTKQRSKQRVIGTLVGAAIATGVILLTQNIVVYIVISVISLPIAFSILQSNYRNAAVFITLHIVFVYAILEPDILLVIKFRVLDTLIGATLAFGANYFLWPAWQFQNIHTFFSTSIQSNRNYLEQIHKFYHEKGEVSTVFKLSRKDAFLNIGNLNAAFQRMNQDPKSKQKELSTIYEIITNSNTFLSSLASLGMFIRNNKTTKVPVQFDVFVEHIISNLKLAIQLLEEEELIKEVEHSDVKKAQELYDNHFENLSNKRDKEIEEGIEISADMAAQLKEAQLVSEQVKWLFNLSEKLVASIKSLKTIQE